MVAALPQEMIRGVSHMVLAYHQSGATSYVAASAVTSWLLVDSVQITLTLASTDTGAGVGSTAIQRKFVSTATLRNRVN